MKKWYNKKAQEVVKELSKEGGLSAKEALARLNENGRNVLNTKKKKTLFMKILSGLNNSIIILLIVAAVLSGTIAYMQGESFLDSIVILIVVILNVLLEIIEENKADKAIELLNKHSANLVHVRRDSKVLNISAEELVVGDIVILETGNLVPADMRIIESTNLKTDESVLTGESVPVEKESNVTSENVSLADRKNMVYSSTSVVYGRAECVVCETGMNTEIGKIAKQLNNITSETTLLQKNIDELTKILSILVIIIAIIVGVIQVVTGKTLIDAFMFAVVLAVAAVPEGLSSVITIILALGSTEMSKKNVIVRKMSSIETLGCVNVICTDKTGTITKNEMTIEKVYVDLSLSDVSENKNSENLIKISLLCNDSLVSEKNGELVMLGDPTETCMVKYANDYGVYKNELDKQLIRVYEVPFDSTRKMMTTINKIDESKYMVCTKGAIESVIEACKEYELEDVVLPMEQNTKDNILNENLELASSSYRVMSFAYKIIDEKEFEKLKKNNQLIEKDLIFVGMFGIIDPPREEVKDAVYECNMAGITPIMITGDNINIASNIAKKVGIMKEEDSKIAINGYELDEMSEEEFESKIGKIAVYARVTPENKLRIVNMWKKKGNIVAMTGDGVNDSAAIKSANVGIGMGITGSDVSKNVASIVLEDDNFATIVSAIREGRRIYSNIQNVIVYLLASNLAEVIMVFIATLFGKEIFTPIQFLWINLITDTIPAIALGFEKVSWDIMKKSPRKSSEKLLNKDITTRIIVFAVIKSIIILVTYFTVLNYYTLDMAETTSFVLLTLLEIAFAISCRTNSDYIYKQGISSNKPMLYCSLLCFMLQVAALFVPFLKISFGIADLTIELYLYMAIVALFAFLLFEMVKKRIYVMLNKDKVKSKIKVK